MLLPIALTSVSAPRVEVLHVGSWDPEDDRLPHWIGWAITLVIALSLWLVLINLMIWCVRSAR